jgi:D-alanyl-lipoteichoic acid acyltransferase DltB (MBOAT superfamily)
MMQAFSDLFAVFWHWISVFDKTKPLIFTQWEFWLFFLAVMLVFSALHRRIAMRNAFLFGISLFFYFKTSGLFWLLLVFSTFTDYGIAFKIHDSTTPWKRKAWLAISLFLNLGALSYFKYAYFFTDAANKIIQPDSPFYVVNWLAVWANQFAPASINPGFSIDSIALPVGVSFFTFQTMSYSIDVYRGQLQPVKNILDFGFYVSFFPQLVAGPIVRASEFIPQIYKPFNLSRADWSYATFLIFNGLAKKLILADYLAVQFVDKVFATPEQFMGLDVVMGLLVYSLQVYADFSGYTDIAIGVALLMGFTLHVNFDSPYKARNVAEFWRRWHISLSSWLKDYLYIPLGGNRKATAGTWIWTFILMGVAAGISGLWWLLALLPVLLGITYALGRWQPGIWKGMITNINMLLTMLIGGLWHGASWNFLVWGGLNGLGLLVYKGWKRISPYEHSRHPLITAWKVFITFIFISFTRLFFRSGDIKNPNDKWELVESLWQRIWIGQGWEFGHVEAVWSTFGWIWGIFALGMLIHWLPSSWKQGYRSAWGRMPLYAQIPAMVLAIFIFYQFMNAEVQSFIYFQF